MAGKTVKVYVGPGKPYDLVLVCLIVTFSVLLSALGIKGPLMWVFGFLAVFFAPGYAIVSALFPGRKAIITPSFTIRREEHTRDITMMERLVLGVVLGSAVMALAGTVVTRGLVDYTALVVGVIAIFLTFIFSAVAVSRRARLPMGDQFVLFRKPNMRSGRFSASERAVSMLLIAAVVVLAAVAITGLNAKPVSGGFSEFSVTGSDGSMDLLPSTLASSQPGLMRITVVSHLGNTELFNLVLSLQETPAGTNIFDPSQMVSISSGQARSYQFELDNSETWERTISFVIPTTGHQTLYLILDDGTEVKRLWLSLEIT